MLIIYTALILLAAFPLVLTIWRMQSAAIIKKKGVYTDGIVTHIRTLRTGRGGAIDILTLEYKDRATGKSYNGRATVTPNRYKTGDTMTIAYLPDKPAKYAIDTKKAYWAVLIFCIVLFLFVVFAVYKINEMVEAGSM